MATSNSNSLITVFGGAGYIGAMLVRKLLEENYRVRVFDNFTFGQDGLDGLTSPLLEIINGDICDTCAVSQAVEGSEAVVLLAAVIGRRAADIDRKNMREVNLLASSVVLDSAIEHGASRFLFASTDSVYGLQRGVMYETGTPEPVSLYSRLKLRMEERVIKAKTGSFHPSALRIATCHGYSPRMRFDLVANSLVRDAVCKKEITIESGEARRALVHVEDVARAFVACLEAHENLISGEVFNVGAADHNIELNDLINIVGKLVPDAKIHFSEGVPDLVDYYLSCAKIEKILDFSPKWSLEASMEQLRDMLLENKFPEPFHPRYHNT